MSGLNAQASDRDTDIREDLDMETLSTGLENLDQAIEREGLRIGTLVAVLSEPSSPGDILAANMIANRPAYYYTFARPEQQVRRNIRPISNVNLDQVQINEVDSETPIETLHGVLENTEFPRGVTVVLDPVNVLEQRGHEEYKSLLQTLQEKIADKDGLGVLFGVSPEDSEPENRWLTTYTCDTVMRILHQTSDETVEDYLSMEKLYPGQSMIDEDARVFELSRDLDMDIATSRNISP